jgi:thiol-disulfide isomerase/thioredoxin
MNSDRVELLLREIDVPVEPRVEFASELFDRLVQELEAPSRPQSSRIARRNPRLLFALAAAAVLVIVVGAVIARPGRAAAADVVRRATESITGLTQVRATVRYDLNPDGARPDMPRGATAEIEVEYVRGVGYRAQLVAMDPQVRNMGVGSLVVWDGKQIGYSRSDPREFTVIPALQGFDPLRDLGWNSPYPNWEDICARLGSEVLASTTIASRPASHLRCGIGSSVWDLWVDQETGFMLKIRGELGRDDFKLGTSAAGGFEVTQIDYSSPIDPSRFAITAPAGATTPRQTPDVFPPFRATVVVSQSQSGGGPAFSYRHELLYRDPNAWRIDFREDDRGGDLGPGSVMLWDGSRSVVYYGPKNMYSSEAGDRLSLPNSPAFLMGPTRHIRRLPDGTWAVQTDQLRPCVPQGSETLAGRATSHLVCQIALDQFGILLRDFEIWLDQETNMSLKIKSPVSEFKFEVLAIEYRPAFPEDAFTFTPPPGARTVEEAGRDPFTNTSLRRGAIAPTWSGRLIDGAAFDLASTRGRPTLILIWATWCSPVERACDVLRQFEELSRRYANRANFISVDLGEDPEKTRKSMDELGVRFPVINDKSQDIARTWDIQGVPLWVVLDRDGRVLDGAVGGQTIERYEELLRRAGL